MDLSLARWEQSTAIDREALARQLASELPSGFAFDSVRTFECGVCRRSVAHFIYEGGRFVLVPATEAEIGFNATRWEPSAEESESWQQTADDNDIKKSIEEHVADATLRPRTVGVGPLLVETIAGELGWERISTDDAEVRGLLLGHRSAGRIESAVGGISTRVRRCPDGSVIAERSLERTHAELAEQLRSKGCRFPTSDEWEYLCGCGQPTLFRWGDHSLCDRYPTDISPDEASWRRNWVLSGGKLEYPPEGFGADWDLHRRPNALGLSIAFDPYRSELTAEIGTTRGGDGGGMICGGAGFFIGWLTLATAYFEEHACRHDSTEPIDPGFTVGRRVFDLR